MKRISRHRRGALTVLATVSLLQLMSCEMIGIRLQSPIALTTDSRIGPGKMTADAIQSEVMSFTDNFSGSVAQRWNEAAAYRPAPSVKDPEAPVTPGSRHTARKA